jgi:hydroxymethylbilane synthase
MTRKIRIGTRGSDLALWQARHVASRLAAAGHETELVILETRGDRIDNVPLQSVEGKGFFTKELEDALLEDRIDLAVHSHKDLPSAQPHGLVIAAVPERASGEERLLIAPDAHDPGGLFLPLMRRARVGTSAPRRAAQLAALRADLELLALRGNVPTRVRRLREGRYDAIVLAAAGLERLGLDLTGLVVETIPSWLLVPAPAQGALAVQTRANDQELRTLCGRVLADPLAAATVEAERSLLVAMGGGCNLPLGVALQADSERSWHAFAFLGAGHPGPEHPARWCRASGTDPAAAVAAVSAKLSEGKSTGQGPLEGLSIALTGTRTAAEELAVCLASLGARVLREEVLEIEDLEGSALARRVASLRPGDALAFTSAHAARRLRGLIVPEGVLFAAVGEATARELAAAGLRVDIVGQSGARMLASKMGLASGARVLFPCAENARADLEDELSARGVTVERLVLYRTRAKLDAVLYAEADVRLYLSPSAVEAALGWEQARFPRARRVAMGASTAAALSTAGLSHEEAPSTDTADLLDALVRPELSRRIHSIPPRSP